MNAPEDLITAGAVAVALLACHTDIRTRRIPNVLTFGAAAAALLAHAVAGGAAGLGTAALGWAVGVVVFLPFFLLGGMGAGDVKLLGALGAWLGPWEVLSVAVCASIAGGVLAVIVALGAGYLRTAVSNVASLVRYWAVAGVRPCPELTLDSARAPRLAYAVPIGLGTMVTLWLR